MEVPLDALPTYTTVQVWYESLQRQGPLPDAVWQERLHILAAFCNYLGQSPDEIIAACWRHTPDGKAVRTSVRQQYAAQITAFQQHLDNTQRARVQRGNVVRSFLIHNGILLQTGWLYRPPSSTSVNVQDQ